MSEHQTAKVNYVIGPDGSPLTVADLPPPDTKGVKPCCNNNRPEPTAAARPM